MDQDTAILHLLSDDDPETVTLVKAKLTEVKTVEALRQLRDRAEGAAAFHLEALLIEAGQRMADQAFTAALHHLGEHGDLEEASWLLAATFAPMRDLQGPRRLLNEWGAELHARLEDIRSAEARVETAVHFLGRELRLRGNDADYYAINNSLLHHVVETRLGIPISLALVYMLVGRRARFAIEGVSLPGHFVVRHENVFFDPFHGGRRIGLEECSALLQQQNLALTPQHLTPATSRQMLLRMLTNIYYIAEQSNPALAAKVSHWAEMLK